MSGSDARKRAEERAQTLADRYLSHVEIRNLSLLVPRPRDLVPDPTAVRLLRLPAGNFFQSGISLMLRKYPYKDFTTHQLTMALPQDPNFLTFRVTRAKTTGDFTLSGEFLKQVLELAVQNVGSAGRNILLYDGRDKTRLNLRCSLHRAGHSIFDRLAGLTGSLRLDSLSPLQPYLPDGSNISGQIVVDFSASDTATLRETTLTCRATAIKATIPGITSLDSADIDLTAQGGVARIEKAGLSIGGFISSHTGTIDLRNPDVLTGDFESWLAGDRINLKTGWAGVDSGAARVFLVARRDSGQVSFDATRTYQLGVAGYRDIHIKATVGSGSSLWDVIPTGALSKKVTDRFKSFFDKVTVLGPIEADFQAPSPADWPHGLADIRLDGARIVNRLRSRDQVLLGGRIKLSAGRLSFLDTSVSLDALSTTVSGNLEFAADSRKVTGYDLAFNGRLQSGKSLVVTGQRVADSLGLARPPFDSLEIQGSKIIEAEFRKPGPVQWARLTADRFRLRMGGRPWWIDRLNCEVKADEPPDESQWKPRNIEATATFKLFDIAIDAAVTADFNSNVFRVFRIIGQGDDLKTLLSGLTEIPVIAEFARKWRLTAGGAFSLKASGKGPFKRPSVEGSLDMSRLEFHAMDFAAQMPFSASFFSPKDGLYRGSAKTRNASVQVRGVAFPLSACSCDFSWDRTHGASEEALAVQGKAQTLGLSLDLKGDYLLKKSELRKFHGKIQSEKIEDLAREIARIGKFNIPFALVGNAAGEWNLSGNPSVGLRGDGFLDFADLGLTVPLKQRGNQTIAIQVEGLGGRIEFARPGTEEACLSLKKLSGKVLGGDLSFDGTAHLQRQGEALVPQVDGIVASFTGLPADRLFALLSAGYFAPETAQQVKEVGGILSGNLNVGGSRNRFYATGEATLRGGRLSHSLFKERLQEVQGRFLFSRRAERPKPEVEIRDLAAIYGRSKFDVKRGRLVDPQGAATLDLDGHIERAYPTDILSLLSGWYLPTVSFPKEGTLAGGVRVSGTLGKPRLELDLTTTAMLLNYSSEGQTYTVPLGKSAVELSFDPSRGIARVRTCSLGLLNGRVKLNEAVGTFVRGRARQFRMGGSLEGIDMGSLRTGGEESLRGILDGTFTAEQTATGSREALFHLTFRDLVINKIPMDREVIEKIGLDFLDQPEFKEGKLNLYLSNDEEQGLQGKIRVADGLFAGPDMRLEISNSAFDPLNLELAAKVFFNPQPLRSTKLGKRLGSLTKHLQDSATGLPYLDLTVSGRWDNPGLMGKTLTKRAEKRGKRNFISSIFGGHRTHKASVEELQKWFPGWKPGGLPEWHLDKEILEKNARNKIRVHQCLPIVEKILEKPK